MSWDQDPYGNEQYSYSHPNSLGDYGYHHHSKLTSWLIVLLIVTFLLTIMGLAYTGRITVDRDCPLEKYEHKYRPLDGSGSHPWVSGSEPSHSHHQQQQQQQQQRGENSPLYKGVCYDLMIRYSPDHYSSQDGQEPCGENRPNPATISDKVFQKPPLIGGSTNTIENVHSLSLLTWIFSEFIAHELSETFPDTTSPMMVGDQFVTHRSSFAYDHHGNRQQHNLQASFIDGSSLYGTAEPRILRLRAHTGGRMKVSNRTSSSSPSSSASAWGSTLSLPLNEWGLENEPDSGSKDFFLTGDHRSNRNIPLLFMHYLFVMEHNHWADHFHFKYPTWDDDHIFQMARKITVAIIQAITFNEYLPALLGVKFDNRCYDSKLDPSIHNEFAVAISRFYYTLAPEFVEIRHESTGRILESYPIGDLLPTTTHGYKQFSRVVSGIGLGGMMLGLASQSCEAVDPYVTEFLRDNTLIARGPQNNKSLVFDAVVLQILRGRDHGLPDYASFRKQIGGPPLSSWKDVSSDPIIADNLRRAYGEYGWKDMDLFVGMLSEDVYPGSALGYTLHHIMKDQFQRLRDSDRYFYLRDPELISLREIIHSTTLRELIIRHTDVDPYLLNANVFMTRHQGAK